MKYQYIRENVLHASLESSRLGLIHGTSGNISMRDDKDDVIAITPSGIPYEELSPKDIVIVDLKGTVIDGSFKPSSETPMHIAVYRSRKDIKVVVHTHSLFATVMSMSMQALKTATVPSCIYSPIPVAPFEMPGSEELAQSAVKTLGKSLDVILLQNHGLLATGPNMETAMSCAIYTEECAQVCYYALAIPNASYIPVETAKKIQANVKSGGSA